MRGATAEPDAEQRKARISSSTEPSMNPIENAVHLCVDMQLIFRQMRDLGNPWMERVLPTKCCRPCSTP
jgi:hypothetical protein